MSLFSFFNRSQVEQGGGAKETVVNDMLEALAKASGQSSVSVAAGGTINLTTPQSEYGILLLTGAPGSAVTVVKATGSTSPSLFQNLTTGGQTIQVKMSGGSAFTVPVNSLLLLLSATDAVVLGSDTAALALATTATAGTSEELARVDHKHPRDVIPITLNLDLLTLTDLPAALTELNGQTHRRTRYDLTQFTQARVLTRVETAGAAGSELRVQYSTDESSWAYLDNSAGPASNLDATGVQSDGYVTLTAGALTDVYLRPVTINGDGAADPVIGAVVLEVK